MIKSGSRNSNCSFYRPQTTDVGLVVRVNAGQSSFLINTSDSDSGTLGLTGVQSGRKPADPCRARSDVWTWKHTLLQSDSAARSFSLVVFSFSSSKRIVMNGPFMHLIKEVLIQHQQDVEFSRLLKRAEEQILPTPVRARIKNNNILLKS